MRTGISIVAMDRPHVLAMTFRALEASSLVASVIVDNGSTDPETVRMIDAYLQKNGTAFIRNSENIGLSRAVNQGLAELYFQGFDLLVHLDDDAVATDAQSIGGWSDAMDNSPELGLALPNVMQYIEFIFRGRYNELRWGLGFAWGIRREAFEAIGGYDPQLLHQQECDLAIRVRMAGYTVGAVSGSSVKHNDPGGERSDISKAREHFGCVQFRDKWTSYFRGAGWDYGTMPLYLMQHWPPDQEWYRRYAELNGVDLNPPPPMLDAHAVAPGATLGLHASPAPIPCVLTLPGGQYMPYVDIRNEYSHWARGDGYTVDRQKAIDRWAELTGEVYQGYRWPNLLKPQEA